MVDTFVWGPEWELMTPLEWAVSGFDIKLEEGPGRTTDSEIEELIEENWKNRQAERKNKGVFVEEAWPKAGYRGHRIDLEQKLVVVTVGPADWKSMQGTHYNPKFFDVMLKRFNAKSRSELSFPSAHEDPSFQTFIEPYLDGAMGQCAVIYTASGIPIGFRSDDVGVADNVWHVPGGYFPGPGKEIYKSEVPKVNDRPIVDKTIFTLDVESMKANAGVNYFKESGQESGQVLLPRESEITYLGLIRERPNHGMQFLSVVSTSIERFGTNWEHGQMRHFSIDEIPNLVNNPVPVLGSRILRGGEANLVVAYLRERGLERIGEFPFVNHLSTNR